MTLRKLSGGTRHKSHASQPNDHSSHPINASKHNPDLTNKSHKTTSTDNTHWPTWPKNCTHSDSRRGGSRGGPNHWAKYS